MKLTQPSPQTELLYFSNYSHIKVSILTPKKLWVYIKPKGIMHSFESLTNMPSATVSFSLKTKPILSILDDCESR